jgi:hypothetical protein
MLAQTGVAGCHIGQNLPIVKQVQTEVAHNDCDTHRCNLPDQNNRIVRRRHRACELLQELEAFHHRMESSDF